MVVVPGIVLSSPGTGRATLYSHSHPHRALGHAILFVHASVWNIMLKKGSKEVPEVSEHTPPEWAKCRVRPHKTQCQVIKTRPGIQQCQAQGLVFCP